MNDISINEEIENNISTFNYNFSEEETDFSTRDISDIIKVRNCQFENENSSNSKFFFCECQGDKFHPICMSCSKECHKNHKSYECSFNNSNYTQDKFICYCGQTQHEVNEFNPGEKNNKNSVTKSSGCTFNYFHNLADHLGFYLIKKKNLTLCSVCYENCLSKSLRQTEITKLDSDSHSNLKFHCGCENHSEKNIFNICRDLTLLDKNSQMHFVNFNVNIFNKCDLTLKKFLEFVEGFLEEINNEHSQNLKEIKVIDFFTNFFILQIFELFSNMVNKYTSLNENIFHLKMYKEILLEMMKENNPNRIPKNLISTYSFSKIYFAEIIYYYFISKYFTKDLNRVNLSTYTNFNLIQRFLYLHWSKKIIHEQLDEVFINDYADSLLELFTNLSSLNNSYNIEGFQLIFEKFNKIFKNLIKYNFISESTRKKYFTIIQESLNTKKGISERIKNLFENPRKSSFFIIKSVFYSMVYKNDKEIQFNLLKKKSNSADKENSNFVFFEDEESDLYSLIFGSIINKVRRNEIVKNKNVSSLIKFDFYVKKIFDLILLNKNKDKNFYISSIENLKFIKNENISPEKKIFSLQNILSGNLKENFNNPSVISQNLELFTKNMNSLCDEYSEHSSNIKFSDFVSKSDSFFKEFSNFLKSFLSHFPDMSKGYLNSGNFLEIEENKTNLLKISMIQECVVYSLFFSTLNKFLSIYSERKFLFRNEINSEIKQDNLEFILNFCFILIRENFPLLNLFMSISAKNFIYTFYESSSHWMLNQFLSCLMEQLFNNTSDYKLDNFFFYVKLCIAISEKIVLSDNFFKEQNEKKELESFLIKSLNNLGMFFKLCSKPMRAFSIHNSEITYIIELGKKKLLEIKKEKILMEILNNSKYFDEKNLEAHYDCEKKFVQLNESVYFFLENYFEFVNEILKSDVCCLNLIEEEEHFLYNKDFLSNFFFEKICLKEKDFFLKAKIAESVLELKFNFVFKNSTMMTENVIRLLYTQYNSREKIIDTSGENFYLNERNISLIHLTDYGIASNATINSEIKEEDTKYFYYLSQLNLDNFLFLSNLITRLELYLNQRKNSQKNLNNDYKILPLFKYYNSLIVKPLYILINHYLLKENELKGEESSRIYQLLLNFLNVTLKFYEHQWDNFSININREFSSEGILVKSNLKEKEIEEIKNNRKELTETIRYFELEKILKIYKNCLCLILNENSYIKDSSSDEYIKIVEKLSKNYDNSFKSMNERNSTLVKILSSNTGDVNKEIRKEIYSYLNFKFNENLNVISESEGNPKYINRVFAHIKKIEDIRFENFYSLNVLRHLISYDLEGFQKLFKDINSHRTFFLFLAKYFIFNNILNQCKLNYELDCYRGNVSPRPGDDLADDCFKILIYLCDSKNEEMQKFFYELFIPGSKDIINKPIRVKLDEPKARLISENLLIQRPLQKDEGVRRNTIPLKHTNNINKNSTIKQNLEVDAKNLLEMRKYSFLNFVFVQLKILIKCLHLNENSLLHNHLESKNYKNLLKIFENLYSLVNKMIIGSKIENFGFFYKKIPNVIVEDKYFEYSEYFIFLKYASDIKDLNYSHNNIIDRKAVAVKTSIFSILNTLISQDLDEDDSIVSLSASLFNFDQLLMLASKYLRALYIRHCLHVHYKNKNFVEIFDECELNQEALEDLLETYKENKKLSEDSYFKLASQMYLYIYILSEKYHKAKAQTCRSMVGNELVKDCKDNHSDSKYVSSCKVEKKQEENVSEYMHGYKELEDLQEVVNVENRNKKSRDLIRRVNPANNMIITGRFFNEVVSSCELVLSSSSSTSLQSNDKLKTVFFIVDPSSYLISNSHIQQFYEEVDRTSPSSKLKGLLHHLPIFQSEIIYRKYLKEKSKYAAMFDINYKHVDLINLIFSTILVIILMISFTLFHELGLVYNYLIYPLAELQILINIIFLSIFYIWKKDFYIILSSKSTAGDKSLTERFKLHLLDTFLWTEDTYIITINTIVSLITLLSPKFTFLFTLQLFTVIRFVDIMQQVVHAFKMRFGQLITMLIFLAILSNFYAMFSFYLIPEEFILSFANNKTENVCQTLLSCYMTFFNYGVSSNGGIGDILNQRFITDGSVYWLRYLLDLIFYVSVVLIILNMINGIVICAFSSLRDESEKKMEDISGKCFICNISKEEFEKRKIDFNHHVGYEHNYKIYIKYLVGLMIKQKENVTCEEIIVLNCVKNRDIKFFPIGMSIHFGDIAKNENEDDE